MKVAQIFENEWANKEVTLKYLWKKQLSACHRFVMLAMQIGFYSAGVVKSTNVEHTLSNMESSSLDPMTFSLERYAAERKWDKRAFEVLLKTTQYMINVKKKFEQAGGQYESK